MKFLLTLLTIVLVATGCFNKVQDELCVTNIENPVVEAPKPKVEVNPNLYRNGKDKTAFELGSTYNLATLDDIKMPEINDELIQGLKNQIKLLKRLKQNDYFDLDNIGISITEMESVVKTMIDFRDNPSELKQYIDGFQLNGKDQKGSVYFTGYYTPVIEASPVRTEEFNHAIYRYPNGWDGQLPSREEIDGSIQALEATDSEVAFAKYPEDVYYMQVQGSGFVQYPNGETKYLGFDGSNRHRYKSIERYMIENKLVKKGGSVSIDGVKEYFKENPEMREEVLFHNPSYVFFEENGSYPLGSGTVPLTPNYSIAVDKTKIPLGSVLLAAIPIYQDGRIANHEYRFLLAQDVGGAIKGTGHIDLYSGSGDKGQKVASQLHHYGNLWLLKPKSQT